MNKRKFADEKEFFAESISSPQTLKILDIGTHLPGRKGLFRGHDYITLNVSSPTDIIGDAHTLPFEDGTLDAIICISTLAYLHSPEQFMDEAFRVLKKGGIIYASALLFHPYNGSDVIPEYWRITKPGIEYLFRKFSRVEIEQARGFFYALGLFIPILRFPLNILDTMISPRNTCNGYSIKAHKA